MIILNYFSQDKNMSEVNYLEFQPKEIIFKEIKQFESLTSDGKKVSNTRMHMGYPGSNYIQLELPLASVSIPKFTEGFSEKESIMMLFDDASTKQFENGAPQEFMEYDQYLDKIDEMVKEIIKHLMKDEANMDLFKIEYEDNNRGKIEKIETDLIVKSLTKSLTHGLYYVPPPDKNYRFSTFADVIVPPVDKDNSKNLKPPTMFHLINGQQLTLRDLSGYKIVGIPIINLYVNRSSKLSVCRLLRSFFVISMQKVGASNQKPKSFTKYMSKMPEQFLQLVDDMNNIDEQDSKENSSEHYEESYDDEIKQLMADD